jgi:hypothetical protein
MRTPKTLTLVVLSVGLFAATGLLMRGVVAVRPVRPQAGDVMHVPDGRPLMERDTHGQLLVNWDAYVCMGGGFVLLGWALARVSRHWCTRIRGHEARAA